MKYKNLSGYAVYLLVFFIFTLDLITPLGVASGTPYGLAVCLTFWSKDNHYTFYITFLSITLTILGYYLSPEVVSPHYVVVINRALAIVIIIVSSLFVAHQRKLDRRIKELSILSTTDPLTQIGNRLAFNLELTNEFSRYKRYARPLTIALVDIDNLKFINDSYGHFAGDEALRNLAKFIESNIRDSDHFYRIGGDEFAILFVETYLNEGVFISNLLREGVEKICSHLNYPLTISTGVAVLHKHETQEQWINRADIELYNAKKSGKNKVCYEKPTSVLASNF